LISHIYIKKGSGFPGKYRGKQKQRQQGGSKVAVCEEKKIVLSHRKINARLSHRRRRHHCLILVPHASSGSRVLVSAAASSGPRKKIRDRRIKIEDK